MFLSVRGEDQPCRICSSISNELSYKTFHYIRVACFNPTINRGTAKFQINLTVPDLDKGPDLTPSSSCAAHGLGKITTLSVSQYFSEVDLQLVLLPSSSLFSFGKEMISVRRSGLSIKNGWSTVLRSYYGVCSSLENKPAKDLSDVLLAGSSSTVIDRTAINEFTKRMNMVWTLCPFERSVGEVYHLAKSIPRTSGILALPTGYKRTYCRVSSHPACHLTAINGANTMFHSFTRSFASKASNADRENKSESRKEVSTVDSPFTDITDEIPQTPVTFKEGASYSVVILAGLGIAAAAAYAVFKELIFQPKEYKIFNKALERIQNDSQVRVRIGSPITGYGQESRNRAARQRIPNRIWTDEDGIEHVEVNFYIRGPHGGGKVYSEMFKDKEDKQWKFTYLIIDIKAPSPAQLMLESYVPA